MAEYWVNNLIGSDSGAGTENDPWFTVPGLTGANAVIAGDIINVRNGTTQAGRLNVPANNLTYRGYGLADNVLELRLPMSGAPFITCTQRIMRDPGVHEGMWILDGTAVDLDGSVNTGIRTGVVIEDMQLYGSQIGSRHAMTLATSAANVSGFTLRRFEIVGAAGRGITGNTKSLLIELGRITHTKDDNIGLNAWAANGYRAGSVDVLRDLELIEPNRITLGAGDTGSAGDHLHLQPADGRWDGSLDAQRIRCSKTTGAKQAAVLHATAADSVIRLRDWSLGGGGDCQILVGHIKGIIDIQRIHAVDWATEALPLFRFAAADTNPQTWAMDTGSVLRIKNVLAKGVTPSFYRSVDTEGARTFDGLIEIENNTILGTNITGSALAVFEFWSASDLASIGVNFQLRLRNNVCAISDKPQVKIPSGMDGDARYQIEGNRTSAGTYQVGETTYTDIAAFEAAHSYATDNSEGDPMVTAQGIPLTGSPLIGAGIHTEYKTDITGKAFYNPPSIGAYEYERPRIPRT